jgi:hypothetical protein
MSNPFLEQPKLASAVPTSIQALASFDDDEDDAADDDEDDEVGAAVSGEYRFSRSGFGSPEWWSGH